MNAREVNPGRTKGCRENWLPGVLLVLRSSWADGLTVGWWVAFTRGNALPFWLRHAAAAPRVAL
jgi:hypothetical protein